MQQCAANRCASGPGDIRGLVKLAWIRSRWNGSSVSTATIGCISFQTATRFRRSTISFLRYFPKRRSRWRLAHVTWQVDTFSMMTGRLSASITQQLTEQITQNDDYVGEILTRELSWIQALIDGKLWRRIQLRKRVGSVTVISDASWSQTEDGVISGLCYWVFTEEEPAFGEVCALPESFVARLSDRGTQIMPAEMIASVLPTLLHPGCLVLVF